MKQKLLNVAVFINLLLSLWSYFANKVALNVMYTLITHVDMEILKHPPKIPCYFSYFKYHRTMSYAIPNTGINCI